MTTINNLMETVLMQVPLIIALTWKAATEKAAIYRAIDAVKDGHDKQLYLLDKNLSLLTQESQASRLSLEDKVSGQGKRFGSKFERIEKKVEDVIDFKIIVCRLEEMKDR
ncbi:hypothetical protein FJR11_04380 [Anabaena sp. UHCC 0187]|uniref:hypothetical protein n=1 Tax=Anabaena sp. UHCC 0187 TaxID=2590018 RepID=UPI0014450237|nr:hypothetical protein [Anabaena sp. UHCC 0187]MTJ11844.1 hypothetical protein [Anabaena sp. UHCC 0187]